MTTYRRYPRYHKYQNSDPSTEEHASTIADEIIESIFTQKIPESAKRFYHIGPDAVLAIDLKHATVRNLVAKLNSKVAEFDKFEKQNSNDLRNYPWMVKPQESTTEYDKFWSDVVIHESDSESVKKDKMKLQDKLRGIVKEGELNEGEGNE